MKKSGWKELTLQSFIETKVEINKKARKLQKT